MGLAHMVMRAVMDVDWALGKHRGGATQPAWEVRDHMESDQIQ